MQAADLVISQLFEVNSGDCNNDQEWQVSLYPFISLSNILNVLKLTGFLC